ncbi:glycoside hydrolase family 3 protein [Cellulomonas triticagri]|uniref:Beta-glucosidase n=1 Tax=Cellulomonas triticagri TaxID=2483352 RepID=A0A3M2JKH6_9CELL|nr:glycoside hydrolase family 3 N-terminal domain-containing protein [Cellulomonas triticagri]RMI12716.1 beta-glucosidase [Cellulomonas triticagri]
MADDAVERALAAMDLRERVGQLNQRLYGWQAVERVRGGFRATDLLHAEVERWSGLGALYGLFRADAWSGRTWADGIRPQERPEVAALVSDVVAAASPGGVRPLLVEEAPHGHQALGGALLPTNLAVAAAWDPDLLEEAAEHVAAGLAASGVHVALVSALDVLRDPRWGRCEETFGESGHLAAEHAAALVRGMQGADRARVGSGGVAVVLKHLAGQGEAVGGRNGQSAVIGARDLREVHLPPVRGGLAAGALGVMAAYTDVDGVPCCADPDLLTRYLRDDLRFDGVVMADGLAVDRLTVMTGDVAGAGRAALLAGVDLSLWDEGFTTLVASAETDPRVAAAVERSCRRVLALKHRFGLLGGRDVAPERAPDARERIEVATARTGEVSRRLADAALVLLHDPARTLPLDARALRRVVVAGPFADDVTALLGDYVPPLPAPAPPGVGGALAAALPDAEVVVLPGAVPDAADLAGADAVVLVLGGTSHRAVTDAFDANGAVVVGAGGSASATCGEGVDRADVSLPHGQDALVAAVRAAAPCPVVAVVVAGRPHVLTDVLAATDAVLWAGYPGPSGGAAVADALIGRTEPVGRLPMTLPRHAAAVPVRHDDRHAATGVYQDAPDPVLLPLGHGLRYRDVRATDLRAVTEPDGVVVEVDVVNADDTPGEVVLPLLAHRTGGVVVPRRREVLATRRVTAPPRTTTTVRWVLPPDACFAEGAGPGAVTHLHLDDLTTAIRS